MCHKGLLKYNYKYNYKPHVAQNKDVSIYLQYKADANNLQ